MTDIRLAAFDLDGTALQDDHKTLSGRLLNDLDQAYEKGIEILPVTGRRWFMIPEALKNRKWNHLLVCANGAQICDMRTGKSLFEDDIPHKTAAEIADKAVLNDITMELSGDGCTYLTSRDLVKERTHPELKFHYETVIIPNARIVHRLSETAEKIHTIKIVLIPEDEKQTDRTREILKNLPVYFSETGPHFFEISSFASNKGTGLRHACRILGIDPANTLYIGDSENDIAAMKTAGISVSMSNASAKIRKMCMHVTEDNMHDGLAKALEKYLSLKL